jgi:Bacteriophage tail sheath protein
VPLQVSYPGVYIQEVHSGVHSIVGVSTSATAFVDVFRRGPKNQPVRIDSLADFERTFDGLWSLSEASYAISQYFLNGGETAWVVRVVSDDAAASKPKDDDTTPLKLQAANEGKWGDSLEVAVQTNSDGQTVNVAVRELHDLGNGKKRIHLSEAYNDLTLVPGPKYVLDVINDQSSLICVTEPPQVNGAKSSGKDDAPRITSGEVVNRLEWSDQSPSPFKGFSGGDDGFGDDPAQESSKLFEAIPDLLVPEDEDGPAGMYALRLMAPEIFNVLCLPATAQLDDDDARKRINDTAAKFCADHRAFYVVDCQVEWTVDAIQGQLDALTELSSNAAVYFPALTMPDPLNGNRPRTVGPSGTIAGVIARTDTARGIWKAAAGTEATMRGATPTIGVSDAENGALNELGINVLRTFPVYGSVSWGARTLDGADVKESEWKYIPVRRLALHIENSLFTGTKWAVFEPNDEPLWGQLRLSVGSFMHDLFRQGAFAGTSPTDSYFVHCDGTTTTDSDIANGIVNIVVGFAPLRPAEFVIISIQQIAQL